MKSKRAIIIGGGLGGLALALRLAARDWQVTVCEQGGGWGGKMNVWEAEGFRFDTGPSLITMPWVFEELFQVVGERLEDWVELLPMRPLAEYVYADGTRFCYSSSLPKWLTTLRRIAPDDEDGFFRFMELGARLFELSNATFFRQSPWGFTPPEASALTLLKAMPLRYGWGNYHDTVAAHFKSRYLIQLFDRYPTYVGSSPYRTPATLMVIPYIEHAFGGWYVKGGLYRIVESLVALAKRAGVTLEVNARVERIEHCDRRVGGVRLADGRRLKAEVVVMNGDASVASQLLGEPPPAELLPSGRSLSGVVFLLGCRRRLPQLGHHTVYFSNDYEREFSQLFDERRFPEDPTVYVSAPSRTDRTLVEGEGETLFVMANAPANDAEWSEAQIAEVRQRIFARLEQSGFPDLQGDIAVSDVWTPTRMASRYAMPGGAIYGTHSHGWGNAFFRPPNEDRRYQGLYFVGGSTHPGGGTPTVLMSAAITERMIHRWADRGRK